MNKDRLQEIQVELSTILEERLTALQQSISGAEESTRRILTTELEIQRYEARSDEYKRAQVDLQIKVDAAKKESLKRRSDHDRLLQDKSNLESQTRALEEELDQVRKSTAQAQQQLTAMKSDASSLRDENTKLKLQVKSLSENIDGMRKLKDAQMLSVMNLTKELHQVATGEE